MVILKPKIKDLDKIRQILEQWTEQEEVEKYLSRINSEINGYTKYSMNFWIIMENGVVAGVGGLAKPLPIVLPLAKSDNPGEIKILYINNSQRGKGMGKQLVDFLEKKAKSQGYAELFVRSAERYKDTGHGFYKKIGYEELGKTDNNMTIFHKTL